MKGGREGSKSEGLQDTEKGMRPQDGGRGAVKEAGGGGCQGGPHLHDRVSDSRHALIKGLSDDGKAPGISPHQGGKVGHQVDGRKIICVSNLQSLQKGGQPVIAEAQRLACTHTSHSLHGGFSHDRGSLWLQLLIPGKTGLDRHYGAVNDQDLGLQMAQSDRKPQLVV